MIDMPGYGVLQIYFMAYFLLAFVWRALLVFRRGGVNPLVLPSGDDAYSYIGRAFKLLIMCCGALVVGLAFIPATNQVIGMYFLWQHAAIALCGWGMLLASLLWMLVAQAQMGMSWRIGIDTKIHTALVQHGLFGISRNPIFLATRVNLLGLFFVVPSALTLAIVVAGEILVQVQVRLEEEHLLKLHGESYRDYCSKVRRWL